MYGDFYRAVAASLVADGTIKRSESVLAVCAGPLDAKVLRDSGLSSVTISNLDTSVSEYAGEFSHSLENAESLSFENGSFDWSVVHAGLHHCRSPHRALLEMCRVSRKGVVVIEARDSLLMRLAIALGLTSDFEKDLHTGGRVGGVENGPVPNFVYRWTEREVRKVIESYYPHRQNLYRYFYGVDLPERLRFFSPLVSLLRFFAPRQCNSFAFVIQHSEDLKPWLVSDDSGIHLA